ncbi:MAG: restriction modification system specificity domain protein [Bacteroidetes bacterium]|nr:restriction modification system specificity domain protein [Bacteroidota bacterium]
MNNWETTTLGEICNFRRGHDLPKYDMQEGEIPVAGSNGIIGYHDKQTNIEPCITIGRSGNVGTPYYYEKCWAHNTALYIDDYKGNDPKFIYYFIKTLNLGNYAGGSAVPTLNRNHIHPIEVFFPIDIDEQIRIADVLSALDDKIEVNNKINENLEAQAQAIFKQWFVDFEFPDEEGKPYKTNGGKFIDSELGKIPEGWRVGTLGDVIKNIKISIKKEEVNELPYLPIDIIPMNKLGLIEFKPSNEAQSSLIKFEKNDILIGAMRVYFHRVSISPCEGVTRSTCFVLRPIKYELFEYALLVCNQNATIDYAQNTSKGSTMPYAVWENGLSKMKIIIPSEEILDEFSIKTKPIISYLRDSLYEKINLSELRDSLLPKLMNGEVRV